MSSLVPWWVWLIIGVVGLVGLGGGVFFAAGHAGFLVNLAKVVASQVWNALAPIIFKRKSAEEEAADRQHEKEGGLRPNQDHK